MRAIQSSLGFGKSDEYPMLASSGLEGPSPKVVIHDAGFLPVWVRHGANAPPSSASCKVLPTFVRANMVFAHEQANNTCASKA